MVAPLVAGAAIGAGASLLGGLLGSRSARRQQREGLEAQREFAQQGIRWRVEDAKAAGLHPLYALGASTSGPSFSVMDDPMARGLSEAGQNVSRAVQAQETAAQTEARLAALDASAARASADRAQADYYSALAAKARQETNVAKPFPDMGDASGYVQGGDGGGGTGIVHQGVSNPFTGVQSPFYDRRVVEPSKVVSASSNFRGAEAGASPHWKSYTYDKAGGLVIDLPAGSGPSEAYESMGENPSLLWMVVDHNISRYGLEWLGHFYSLMPALFQSVGDVVGSFRGGRRGPR